MTTRISTAVYTCRFILLLAAAAVAQVPVTPLEGERYSDPWAVGEVGWIRADDGYAYLTADDFMIVLDVSDASAPAMVGRFEVDSGQPFLHGDRLFVATKDDRMEVFDVTDPAAAVRTHTFDLPVGPHDYAVDGDRLYLGGHYDLVVMDISDLGTPAELGRLAVTPGVCRVTARRPVVYLAKLGMQVIDCSDPAAPVEVAAMDAIMRGVVADDLGYFPTYTGFKVYDLSSPAEPTVLGSCGMAPYPIGIALDGRRAVVFRSNYVLSACDVSDPGAPVFLADLVPPGTVHGSPDGLAVTNEILVQAESEHLHTYDISNPQAPVARAKIVTDTPCGRFALAEPYAFVEKTRAGLLVLDLRHPTGPREVALVAPMDGFAPWRMIDGLLAGYAGTILELHDISDPLAPALAAELLQLSGGVLEHLSGTYYRLVPGDRFQVWTAPDPTVPSLAGETPLDTPDIGLAIREGMAVTWHADGFSVISIPMPAYPIVLYSQPSPQGDLTAVLLAGEHLYLSGNDFTLVYDLSPQGSLGLLGALPAGAGQPLFVREELLYTKPANDRLHVYDMTDPALPDLVFDGESPYPMTHWDLEGQRLYASEGIHGFAVYDNVPDGAATTVAGLSRAALHAPSPNPANPRTTLAFTLAQAGDGRLDIYDARGRLVATPLAGYLVEGPGTCTWDGRGDDGRALPSGVYLVQLQVGAQRWREKLTLAR